MSSAVRTIASRNLALAAVAVLGLSSGVMAASSLDELEEQNLQAWAGEVELDQVYAPEGVHTATFYDRTNEYVGPAEIARVAGNGDIELIGPRIELSAPDGEWQWARFASLGGGTGCLFRAVDGLIVRHDCVLPENGYDSRPKVGLADAEASAAIDDVVERLADTWGRDTTVEHLAEVYAPDAVHTARYLNKTKSYTGPEEILAVARMGAPQQVGERVDFEAREGELAWGTTADVAGGSVCIFRAVDGMITRHDCVLPISG